MEKSKFHTVVKVEPFQHKTGYRKKNMFIGSCFTENIGKIMSGLKYPVSVNPFGVLYNPISIANGIKILIDKKTFSPADLFQYKDLWHSFSHHSKFSGKNKKEVLKGINDEIKENQAFLKNTDFLFLTFGTAWVFENRDTNQVVSNCHKLPDKNFRRFRLNTEEIVSEYLPLLDKLFQFNPDIKIVFTVSPVRHWKDGAVENQRSKATLLLAISELLEKYNNKQLAYFPAYEIVMDELRDYRFYAQDMIHISEFASEYIWEQFKKWMLDDESINIERHILKIQKAKNHRPFNKFVNEHLLFLKNTLKELSELSNKFPYINLMLEKDFFEAEIKEIEKYV